MTCFLFSQAAFEGAMTLEASICLCGAPNKVAIISVQTSCWAWSAYQYDCLVRNSKIPESDERWTDQFVVLGGEFGEPLVELQNCYYCHQVPAEEKQTEMEDRTAAAINHLQEQHLALATTTSAHFCARQNKSPLQYPIISHHPHLFITLFIASLCLYWICYLANHLFSRWLKSCRLSSLVSCVK